MGKNEVGIVGLGLVGRALARRLVQADYTVFGYDLAEEAQNRAQEIGVKILPDAQAVARKAKLLLLSGRFHKYTHVL